MKSQSVLSKKLLFSNSLTTIIVFISLLWGHALTWFWESPLKYFRSSDTLYNLMVGRDFGVGIYILPVLATMCMATTFDSTNRSAKSHYLNALFCGFSFAVGVMSFYAFLLLVSPAGLDNFQYEDQNELLQWHNAYALLFGSSVSLAGGLIVALDLALRYALAGFTLSLLSLSIASLGISIWKTYFLSVAIYYLYICVICYGKLWEWSPRWMIALPYTASAVTSLHCQLLKQLVILFAVWMLFSVIMKKKDDKQ